MDGFIEPGRFLQVLGIEAERLIEASRSAPPDTTIPACPGFTIGEVMRHLGGVYRVARLWITSGQSPRSWQRFPDSGQSNQDYLRTGLAELMREFSAHGPDEPAATWWPVMRTYGFWWRRMAHETTMHRHDVEVAAGLRPAEVAEDFAADGVDEALAVWFGRRLSMLGLSGTATRTVGMRAGGHQWIARAGPGITDAWPCSPVEIERADGVVTADAVSMYLWLWGRAGHQDVEWSGNDDAIAQFWALMRLATK